jgi:phosphoglycolate phosphatase-like HAD superfamily hydrolase
MIKNILFDFDGVILDSMKIKANGFAKLFEEYSDDKVAQIVDFHYKNGGVSRFDKIKYFYNSILNKEIDNKLVEEFANKFAYIIKDEIENSSNLIEDSVTFIKNNYTKYNLYIVSGAEHNELNKLCKIFELDKYFISINGSPTKKAQLVKSILFENSYKSSETILIGDSINDYEASVINNVTFFGYNNSELNKYNYIDSFSSFKINEV